MKNTYVAGVDVGSVAAKAVIVEAHSLEVCSFSILPTGSNSGEAGKSVLERVCKEVSITPQDLSFITGTGYGRIALPFATKTVTEISCHAMGAHHCFPRTGIVLDIGGQDSKVILVDEHGSVDDFAMNDKCAAGTGRFLQVVSGILGLSFDELGRAAARGTPAPISSMCAVFAETEIVGLLAHGAKPEDVAAGVFVSIARRMRSLAGRIPMRGECTFTGGLAQSSSFASLLEQELGRPVNVPKHPQIVGAFGAALHAAGCLR